MQAGSGRREEERGGRREKKAGKRTTVGGADDDVTQNVEEDAEGVRLKATSNVGDLGDGRLTDSLYVGEEISS
jgi:hypothetical protein